MAKNRSGQTEYEDEQGRIWPIIRMTPYDRRSNELRDLVFERDEIVAKHQQTDEDATRLADLQPLISEAQARVDRELEHAESDIGRRRYAIDDWRSREGREQYNASRRKKRDTPNRDLSEMTSEQIKQRERDRSSDSKWKKRQRRNGMDEETLGKSFEQRLQLRRQERDLAQTSQNSANNTAVSGRDLD